MSQIELEPGPLRHAVRALNVVTVVIYVLAGVQVFGHAMAEPRPAAGRIAAAQPSP